MGPWAVAVLLSLLAHLSSRPLSASPAQKEDQSSWIGPRIISVKGRRFNADANETTLTAVVVSDNYGPVRVTCDVSCSEPAVNSSCPSFEVITSDINLFIGLLLFNESRVTTRLGPLLFNLTCGDTKGPSRTSTAPFSVTLVKNNSLAFHEPPVTKQLLGLATEPVRRLSPTEMLSFVKALKNVTECNLKLVDVALASAITAEVVDILSTEKNNSDAVIQQVTEAISRIVTGMNPPLGFFVSHLLRIANKLVTAIDIDASLRNNKTFTSWPLAMAAAQLDSDSERKDTVIAFGAASEGLAEVRLTAKAESLKDRASISARVAQIEGGRVAFTMIDLNIWMLAFPFEGKRKIVSPMFTARGKLKGSVLVTFDNEFLSYTFMYTLPFVNLFVFCASWNVQSNKWDRQGCNTTRTSHKFMCHCSQHTNLALVADQEAFDNFWKDFVLFEIVMFGLLSVTILLLCFTIFAYCRYARRKWVWSRYRQAATILAVERSWFTIIMSGILLATEFHLMLRCMPIPIRSIGCLGRDTVSLFCYLLFSFLSVLEGWQAFLCLVARIVLHGLRQTYHGSTYGCFNRNWCLTVVVVILLTLTCCFVSFYESLQGSSDALYALCYQKPGLPIYLGFVLPLTACFAANMVNAALLAYAIIWRSTDVPQKQKSRTRIRAAGYAAVCVLFYITSMVGILSDTSGGTVLLFYVFGILTVLLGVVFFVFYCLLRAEIRKEVRKTFSCCCAAPANQEGDENRPLLGRAAE